MTREQLSDDLVGTVRESPHLAGAVGDHGLRHVQTTSRREKELGRLGQRRHTVGMIDVSSIQ
jgi:hypothetical protein